MSNEHLTKLPPSRGRIGFRRIRDWDSEQADMAGPYHNGDWPFYLMRRIEFLDEGQLDGNPKYLASLLVVAPDAVGEKEKNSCASCCDIYSWGGENPTPEQWAEALMDYGTSTSLFEETGNNKHTLLRQINRIAHELCFTFGFRMDRCVNAIGSSGWDAVSGDILRPLRDVTPAG